MRRGGCHLTFCEELWVSPVKMVCKTLFERVCSGEGGGRGLKWAQVVEGSVPPPPKWRSSTHIHTLTRITALTCPVSMRRLPFWPPSDHVSGRQGASPEFDRLWAGVRSWEPGPAATFSQIAGGLSDTLGNSGLFFDPKPSSGKAARPTQEVPPSWPSQTAKLRTGQDEISKSPSLPD